MAARQGARTQMTLSFWDGQQLAHLSYVRNKSGDHRKVVRSNGGTFS